MTDLIRNVLAQAVGLLKSAGISNAEVDARILLAEAAGVERGRLPLVLDQIVSAKTHSEYSDMVNRRIGNEPVSKIVGRREFFGRDFEINGDVLDPRPETETLVEIALSGTVPRTVLDLGVGSGAILLTLLSEWTNTCGLGVDVNERSIAVARRNAVRLGVFDRTQLTVSNWFENINDRFDLIVSNPPYIASTDVDTLMPDVRDWEHTEALTPGQSGVEAYQIIAKRLSEFLNPEGRALFEIGIGQSASVGKIFMERGFKVIEFHKDLDGRDRVISIYR